MEKFGRELATFIRMIFIRNSNLKVIAKIQKPMPFLYLEAKNDAVSYGQPKQ